MNGAVAFEAAANRRYQWDAQLEEPIEGSVTAPPFLLDEPRVADVAGLSARREPDGLDLGVGREGRLWGADVTVSLQVLNLPFRENATDYDWLQYFRGVSSGHRSGTGRSGLPILPSIGLEARW